jgi:predicted DNA-binding transcriptional regulator AlpA
VTTFHIMQPAQQPGIATTPTNELLTQTEVMERLRLKRSALWQAVKNGTLAAPIKFGARTSRWRKSDIDARLA